MMFCRPQCFGSVSFVLQAGQQLLMFSYGSGLASSMFSIRVPDTTKAKEALTSIAAKADLRKRLAARQERTPEEFNKVRARARACASQLRRALTVGMI